MGEKRFKCTWQGCDRAYVSQWGLTRHIRVHTGERPFVCVFAGCDFASAEKCSLTVHARFHSGEKPFVCDYAGCNYVCTQSSHLKMHMRTHTGEKPYVCTVDGCDFASAAAGDLKKHIRSHTGERPYRCLLEGCGAAFMDSSTLRKHERCVHTETGLKHQKVREEQVAQALTSAGVVYNREVAVRFSTPGRTSRARVDFVIPRDWGAVYLECDERQHRHNPVADEADRALRIFTELMIEGDARKIHMVRFNPDAWVEAGRRPKTPLADRLASLLRALEEEPARQHSVTYLYYTRKDCPLPAICLDAEYPGSLRALVNS